MFLGSPPQPSSRIYRVNVVARVEGGQAACEFAVESRQHLGPNELFQFRFQKELTHAGSPL